MTLQDNERSVQEDLFTVGEPKAQPPKWMLCTRCIGAAVMLCILIYFSGLFFGPSLLTNVKATVPFENVRPVVFFVLIALTVLSAADGVRAFLRHWRGGKALTVMRSPLSAVFSFLIIFLNSVLSFYVIELINNYYLLNMKQQYLFLGWMITFVIYLILVFAFNSLTAGMCIGNILFLSWAIVNYFVQRFRGIPFQWIDFGSMGTGMSVSGNYNYTPTWQIIAGIAVTAAVCGFYLHAATKRVFARLWAKILSRGIAAALLTGFVFVIFHTSFLADQGIWLRDWQPWYTYRLFGMEAGFFAFAKASFPQPPEDYSAARTAEIIASVPKEGSGGQGADIPENIIVIMNESFSDLRVYPNFRSDADLMPGIDSLNENTQKGRLLVSVKGGTTANTEYEFLTGNSCVLSPTTVVYNSFIKQDQFSLARTLAAQGYEVKALHPYGPHGWNRDVVYPRMGFETFLHIDNCFEGAEKLRGFVSDRGDYQEVIRQVESKEDGQKLFLFNITMQNHSAYKNEDFESTVDVVGFKGDNEGQAEQYCSLLRISDEAVMELIDYFRKSDEKTLICFFGDHQPEIGDDFWEYCFGKSLDSLDFSEQQLEFETTWFIWANYDIPELEDETISANYLSSYLLSLTGLERTGYNNFLLDMRKVAPAMNSFGYIDPEGSSIQWDSGAEDPEAARKLQDYKCLIYNELTAGNGRDASFFGLDE